MATKRTGGDRYLARRLKDPEYREAYEEASDRIGRVDAVIRALDQRRSELGFTKAELARRAGVKPEVVRRLFSAEAPNPTINTVVALAQALNLELTPKPRRRVRSGAKRQPSEDEDRVRRRSGT